MNNLFIFIGGSASGKTTLEDFFISKGFNRLVIDTTREPREGEIDGVHYNFRSLEEFNKIDYLDTIEITSEWKYGTSAQELERLVFAETDSIYSVINIEPAVKLQRLIKENNIKLNVYFIYFNIDQEVRVELMKQRGDSDEVISQRLSREDPLSKWQELGASPHIIVDNIFNSKGLVSSFIRGVQESEIKRYSDNSKYFPTKSDKTVEELIEGLKKDNLWK